MLEQSYSPSSELLQYLTENKDYYLAFRFDLDTLSSKIINVKKHPNNPTNLDSIEIIKALSTLPIVNFMARNEQDIAFSKYHYELHIHLSNKFKNRKHKAINKVRRKHVAQARKTYEAIELLNFGYINCDRFFNDPSPLKDIELIVNDASLFGARIFAVFKDINSIISIYYWNNQEVYSFKNIPVGKELQIIALSAKDETPFIFDTIINTATASKVQLNFTATTQANLKEKFKNMN